MACLLSLSHELLHCIFTEVNGIDLINLSKSCRTLNLYIVGNRLLHKDLYLQRYDTPPTKSRHDEPNWGEELHRSLRLEKILKSEDRRFKRDNFEFVADQIMEWLKTAHPDSDNSRNVELLTAYFAETTNRDVFLNSSSLFRTAGTNDQAAAPTEALQQASAKLHCLHGKPVDPVPTTHCSSHYSISPFFNIRNHIHIEIESSDSPSANTRGQTRGLPAHAVARSRVYDLRQYTHGTLWGPFKDDGTQTVDWEKVEAIMLVLGFNLNKFTDRSSGRFERVWKTPFLGATPGSYISPPPTKSPRKEDWDEEMTILKELAPSIDSLDPYGVSGTWMRVVCFLDYNDLYAFNFSSQIPDHEAREPIDTEEGIIYLEETVRDF